MKTPRLTMVIAAAATALSAAPAAKAGSTFFFNANQSYLSANDTPLSGSVKIENFEDGLLNLTGVKAIKAGTVKGSSGTTDSVDGDGGPIDGSGTSGTSYFSGDSKSLKFKFTNSPQGLPTMAGLVWTDGHQDSKVTFKAWDSNNDLIGKIKVTIGDLMKNGGTSEDRFFGLVNDSGISKIQIISNYAGFEVDHLQFSYGLGLAVVPLPSPLALGAVGLLGAAVWRRRYMKKAPAAS